MAKKAPKRKDDKQMESSRDGYKEREKDRSGDKKRRRA